MIVAGISLGAPWATQIQNMPCRTCYLYNEAVLTCCRSVPAAETRMLLLLLLLLPLNDNQVRCCC
jgi:hypothetical protein